MRQGQVSTLSNGHRCRSETATIIQKIQKTESPQAQLRRRGFIEQTLDTVSVQAPHNLSPEGRTRPSEVRGQKGLGVEDAVTRCVGRWDCLPDSLMGESGEHRRTRRVHQAGLVRVLVRVFTTLFATRVCIPSPSTCWGPSALAESPSSRRPLAGGQEHPAGTLCRKRASCCANHPSAHATQRSRQRHRPISSQSLMT